MTADIVTKPRPSPPTARTGSLVRMPGLDGVRAVAVAAVLIFHADPTWLPGGFLGVDVFFTLSGFLITSLLLTELEARGGIRFGRFYQHRAKRLLPAMVAVLIVSSLLAITVAQDAAARLRDDVVASAFYVTNWWYVAHGTSYFDGIGRPPLLQHLWSLAVEEQFYLVWPLILYVLWRVGRVRAVRFGAMAGVLASTAWMGWIAVRDGIPAVTDSGRVYFGTDTHAMTLLAGAVLATYWAPGRRDLGAHRPGAPAGQPPRPRLPGGPRRGCPVRRRVVVDALPQRLPLDRPAHGRLRRGRSCQRHVVLAPPGGPAAALDRTAVLRHLPLALADLPGAAPRRRPRRHRLAGAGRPLRAHLRRRRALLPLPRDADPPGSRRTALDRVGPPQHEGRPDPHRNRGGDRRRRRARARRRPHRGAAADLPGLPRQRDLHGRRLAQPPQAPRARPAARAPRRRHRAPRREHEQDGSTSPPRRPPSATR